MKKVFYYFASVVLLSLTCMLCADNNAQVIQLIEVDESYNEEVGGYVPRDGTDPNPITPPNPNSFYAIINGHVLSVAAPNGPLQSRLIVNKVDGTPVVNFPFRRTATVNLADTGEYTLTIKTGNRTFQGNFTVTD